MKKAFLYIGFLGTGLLAGTSVMAQVAGKQQTTGSRVAVSRNVQVKPAESSTQVRAVTPQAAKVAVANATRQPQAQPSAPAAAQPAPVGGPEMQQTTGGKAGYKTTK